MDTSPFLRDIIVPSFALRNGSISLKAASIFYDRILVIDGSMFEVEVPNVFGSDFDTLQEKGIIEVLPNKLQWLPEMKDLIEATKSVMARAIFTPTAESRREDLLALGANGIARLAATHVSRKNQGGNASPTPSAIPAEICWSRIRRPSCGNNSTMWIESKRATEVVFQNLPVPDELTPWEDILAFRQEHEIGEYALSLYRWLRDASTESELTRSTSNFDMK